MKLVANYAISKSFCVKISKKTLNLYNCQKIYFCLIFNLPCNVHQKELLLKKTATKSLKTQVESIRQSHHTLVE